MKSRLLGAVCATVIALLSTTVNAAALPLEGRLETALGSDVFLAYYDPNQDITWAAEANINGNDSWDNQVAWAEGLTIGGITGWRLGNMDRNRNGVIINCAVATEADCLDNEYGYLYFQHSVNAVNPNPFSNLLQGQNAVYWSESELGILTAAADGAWLFDFQTGGLATNLKTSTAHLAWAVRTGDVPAVVPVPGAVWLFGFGLLGLIGIARK